MARTSLERKSRWNYPVSAICEVSPYPLAAKVVSNDAFFVDAHGTFTDDFAITFMQGHAMRVATLVQTLA